jgi:DNA transposition AAA+ family ATPase
MKAAFVKTENANRFEAAVIALNRRGAAEARFLVVDGLPGLGKTTILDRYASQNEAVFIRAKQGWNEQWLMEDLIAALGLPSQGSLRKNFLKVQEELVSRQMFAAQKSRAFMIFIDEADCFSRTTGVIESIRTLADMSDAAFVLIGMGKLKDNLVRYPQFASRVTRYCHFEPASFADVRLFMDMICEVKVGDDLCEFVRRATGGFNREIKEAIANIERFGFKHSDEVMTCSTMDSQVLVYDRKNGRPIYVISTDRQAEMAREESEKADQLNAPAPLKRHKRGG